MYSPCYKRKKIFLTGGTSGLGLALSRLFLNEGCEVTITGRKIPDIDDPEGRLTFVQADFCDLESTSYAIKEICRNKSFDIVINNAGVLSPPRLRLTGNGFEYTFQVNFLSHLLASEIVIRNSDPALPLIAAATVSMVYIIGDKDLDIHLINSNYNSLRAYSNSKLYLALMCSWLPELYPEHDLKCFAFDPGIFSSEIYRMQHRWFSKLYRIASPFMKSPVRAADEYARVIESGRIINGAVYKSCKSVGVIPEINPEASRDFRNKCHDLIQPYL